MDPVAKTHTSHQNLAYGSAAFLAGAIALSAAATQFVAWRVGYHPALGPPWIGHVYPPWGWIEWRAASWATNARSTFGIVNAGLLMAMALVMLGVMAATTARRRRPVRHEGLHGTARFQSELEIRGGGLLPRRGGDTHEGVYVGGWTDAKGRTHYLRHDGPEHCIVIAPTRSGKGVGNVLPTLLSWPASCVVYDEKGELWALTAGWRAAGGGNVVIRWEPGAVGRQRRLQFPGGGSARYAARGRGRTEHRADAVRPDGKGLADHWQKTSFALLTGLILHVLYLAKASGATASLADVATALSEPATGNPTSFGLRWWQTAISASGPHPVVAAAGRDMLERETRERGSVLSSAKTYLVLFHDPLIAAEHQPRRLPRSRSDEPRRARVALRSDARRRQGAPPSLGPAHAGHDHPPR